jgi:hypothetical protein
MADPIIPRPGVQTSFITGSIVYGPQGVTVPIISIVNEAGVTTLSTAGPHNLQIGDAFSVVLVPNVQTSQLQWPPNFNGSFTVLTVVNGNTISFVQALPNPAPSNGPPLGPLVPVGQVDSGELGIGNPPLVGGPQKFPGPYAYITVSYALIQETFKTALIDPRGYWIVNPATTMKSIFISKRAQADQAVMINQNQIYRMPLQYLTAFPVDLKHGPFAFWPPNRFYFSPTDPSAGGVLMRQWAPVF